MPLYLGQDDAGTSSFSLQDFEPSWATKMNAAVRESWLESYGPAATDFARARLGSDSGPKLSAVEAADVIKQSGLKFGTKVGDGQYTRSQLDVLLERQRELTAIKDIRERTPWDASSALRGVGMFGAGILDPINLATAFVPWTRTLSVLNGVRAAALSESFAMRTGARAVLGAADAGISTAALEPAYAYVRTQIGDDYTALDSLANIAFGTAFGGGIHAGGGAAGDAFRSLTGRAQPFDRFRGLSNEDVQFVTELEDAIKAGMDPRDVQRVLEGFSPEMRRAAGFNDAAARAGMPEIAPERVGEDQPAARADEMAVAPGGNPPEMRQPAAIAARVVEMNDGKFLMAESAAGRVGGTVDGDTLRITTAEVTESMRGQGYGVALYERLVNDALDRGLRVTSDVTVETPAVRVYEALQRRGFIVTRADGVGELPPDDLVPEGALFGPGAREPVFTITRGPDYIAPVPTAADIAASVSPETREASLRASVAQSVDGRNVDVDAILGMDETLGTATRDDAAQAAERTYQPENVATADFDASAAVQARVDQAPKWDGVADAEAALAEADTILADTVRAGDQAFKYSREARDQAQSQAPDVLTTALRQSFGASTQRLMDAGMVRLVATPADIPGGPHPADVKGATAPDGTVYIVAENVSPTEARGMLLHEVGVHVGMREMLGDDLFGSVLTQLDDAILRGESWAQAARRSVPADTRAADVREEQLAYLVQNAPELPIVQRIIAAVRAWAYRTFEFAQERMTLTEADFRAMAVSALHHAARGEQPVGGLAGAFSRAVDQVESLPFKKWFGESKVVDEQGQPLVVYHGTVVRPDTAKVKGMGDIQAFDRMFTTQFRAPSVDTMGSWFSTNPGDGGAQMYSGMGEGSAIYPVYLAIKNPHETTFALMLRRARLLANGVDDGRRIGQAEVDAYRTWLKGMGKDGIKIVDDAGRAGESIEFKNQDAWIALEPEQIKSATGNNGNFDPANPDIRYSRGETPDPSTAGDELKPYDEAVKRAKSYASVLRAAADKLDNDAQATAAMRAAMPDITPQEITVLLDGLRKQVKGLRGMARTARTAMASEDVATGLQYEAMQAADDLANNLEMAAVIEKRNAALNVNARLKATAYVNQFRDAGLDFEGFRGLLVGTERKRAGGRISVEAEQKNFRGEWLGGLIADLEKAELMRHFTSGEFDRDIYVAMWNMGKGQPAGNVAPEAAKIAEIVSKYQQDARNTRNRFGAWIRDLQGYITRQSHDMFKIRDGGEQAWIDYVLPRLDIPKMQRLGLISEADPMASLRGMYDDFAAGSHMKTTAGEVDVAALGTGASLAKRESTSRTLYFKDGGAAFEYNQKFGQGRLAESILQGLDHAGRSAGLLKILGTNPEATVTRLFDEYAESLRGDPARRAKFLSYRKELQNLLAQVDGSVNIPGNVTAAQISSFLRAWQSMSKLGGAVISSITDLANYAAELRFGQDKNLLTGTLDGIGALTQGRAAGEKKAILASLGVFHESTLGSVFARFDSPDLMGGKTAAAMQMFFKLSGLNWWTESLRDGYALTHSNYLASNAGQAFDKLPAALRDMLSLYNIDAGKWEILRTATMQEADGRKYMTPEGLKTVPVAMLENYITSIGRKVSDAAILNLQDDLSSALRTMTIDRMHHAVIEPGARTRAFMLRGTQPGTVPGELLRFVTQFKSFPVALIQMTLGREIYGRGYDTLGDYLKNGKGDMLGLASFIALSTAMGYAAMSAKDLLRGKNPRPVDDPRTWAAAMVQGGGLGLYGDFLFGKYNRMGGTLTGSLAGPVANLADTAADLWTRIRTGDDVAAAAFSAAIQNTPFASLFYARVALDYLVLYRIQEALNPGFLRRMEKRAERENGQTFYLPPSSVAR